MLLGALPLVLDLHFWLCFCFLRYWVQPGPDEMPPELLNRKNIPLLHEEPRRREMGRDGAARGESRAGGREGKRGVGGERSRASLRTGERSSDVEAQGGRDQPSAAPRELPRAVIGGCCSRADGVSSPTLGQGVSSFAPYLLQGGGGSTQSRGMETWRK